MVYTDLGLTRSMKQAVARAEHEGRGVEYRQLDGWEAGGAEWGKDGEIPVVAAGEEEVDESSEIDVTRSEGLI